MPKVEVSRIYQYKVVPEDDLGVQSTRDGVSRDDQLNALGDEGWALVAVTPSRLYVFMRRDR